MSFFRRSAKDKGHKVSKVDLSSIRVGTPNLVGSVTPVQTFNAPQEVVQATRTYIARRSGELSFSKGDFFHVIGQINPADTVIEIMDPVRNVRGTAPTACFRFFEKPNRAASGPNPSSRTASIGTKGTQNSVGSSATATAHNSHSNPASEKSSAHTSSSSAEQDGLARHVAPLPSLCGVVMYDFAAERPDELAVKKGDGVILCAHHDYEWFIGKFLNKIGEPGLIPVTYVRLYDINTEVVYTETPREVIERVKLPTVEQWKAIKNRHKASVRPVGNSSLVATAPVWATEVTLESFSMSSGKYWYLVRAILSDGTTRCLCRYYEDFFNIHQRILKTWPLEGGLKPDSQGRSARIVPFIPGPVPNVSEKLCLRRMGDLDMYLRKLCTLPDYISKSMLVNSFYDLQEGDQQLAFNDGVQDRPIRPTRGPPQMMVLVKQETLPMASNQPGHSASNSVDSPQPYYPDTAQQRRPHHSHHGSLASRISGMVLNHHTSSSQLNVQSEINMNTRSHSRKSTRSGSIDRPMTARIATTTAAPGVVTDLAGKLKLKFYYKEDIFAIAVTDDVTLDGLKRLIVPRIDECDDPQVLARIKLIPKTVNNVDQFEYLDEDALASNAQLWNSTNFVDKGKFLVIV